MGCVQPRVHPSGKEDPSPLDIAEEHDDTALRQMQDGYSFYLQAVEALEHVHTASKCKEMQTAEREHTIFSADQTRKHVELRSKEEYDVLMEVCSLMRALGRHEQTISRLHSEGKRLSTMLATVEEDRDHACKFAREYGTMLRVELGHVRLCADQTRERVESECAEGHRVLRELHDGVVRAVRAHERAAGELQRGRAAAAARVRGEAALRDDEAAARGAVEQQQLCDLLRLASGFDDDAEPGEAALRGHVRALEGLKFGDDLFDDDDEEEEPLDDGNRLDPEAMRDKVVVCCRVRPRAGGGAAAAVRFDDAGGGRTRVAVPDHPRVRTVFDAAWLPTPADVGGSPDDRQRAVFASIVAPEGPVCGGDVDTAMRYVDDGRNATVVCYGHTASGKTYTMLGGGRPRREWEQAPGLIPRTAAYIFDTWLEDRRAAQPHGRGVDVCVTYLELYNERLTDLLCGGSDRVELRETGDKIWEAQPVTRAYARSAEEVMCLVRQGSARRHTGATDLNERSSRSHTVLTFYFDFMTDAGVNVRPLLRFVDLAGSESLSTTLQVTHERERECGHINTSLLWLGTVVNELSKGKDARYSFRNSNLTKLLRNSLGGNSKTYVVATVSLEPRFLAWTVSTLKFAARAKRVRNQTEVMVCDPHAQCRRRISELEREVQRQRDAMQGHNGEVDRLAGTMHSAASSLAGAAPRRLSVRRLLHCLDGTPRRSGGGAAAPGGGGGGAPSPPPVPSAPPAPPEDAPCALAAAGGGTDPEPAAGQLTAMESAMRSLHQTLMAAGGPAHPRAALSPCCGVPA